jgi:hypothetical protein
MSNGFYKAFPDPNFPIFDDPNIGKESTIVNFGNLSVPGYLNLFAGAVHSTGNLSSGNLYISAKSSPVDVANGKRWSIQNPNVNEPSVELQPGDVITRNIRDGGFVGVSGDRVQLGDVQGSNISISAKETITAGHIKAVGAAVSSTNSTPGYIRLQGNDIKVSSLFAWGGSFEITPDAGGVIEVNASNTFQVTDSIPNDLQFTQAHSDINNLNPDKSGVSIFSGLRNEINVRGSNLVEGTNLERDSNGDRVFRLASNPNVQVDLLGITPKDGGLILKNRSTGEITVGDKIVVQVNDNPIPSGISATKGLIIQRNPETLFLYKTSLSGGALPGTGYYQPLSA